MAYDSDSRVDKQVASPGNNGLGQATAYEQKLTGIQLEQKSTSFPIENKATSFQIEQGKNTSFPIEQKVTSFPVEQKTTSIQIEQGKTTSFPVENKTTSFSAQNTARQIDLLSMEQFGHNQYVLRDKLSIIEANSVNTDKEYGVMQVEDKFEFSKAIEISIVDNSNETTMIKTQAVAVGKVEDDKDLKGLTDNGEIIVETTHDTILLPHLSVVNDKKIYGLNVSSDSAVIFKSQTNTVTEFTDGNLDTINEFSKPIDQLVFNKGGSGKNIVQFSMSIYVDSTEADYYLKCKLITNAENSWIGSERESETNWITASGTATAELGQYNFSGKLRVQLFAKKNAGTEYEIPVNCNVYDFGGANSHVEQFALTSNGAIGLEMPQCSIVFTATYDDGDSMTKSWRYNKSTSTSANSLYFENDIVNVYDWS